MTSTPTETPPHTLRDPAYFASPNAVRYWVLSAMIGALVWLTILVGLYYFLVPDSWKFWAGPLLVVLAVISAIQVLAVPQWRYRVHRWEVTSSAVYTRSGWLNVEQRIAPLSRVQTVDSERGPLMRVFNLASITVTTASAAGPITIECLSSQMADRMVAELTAITSATEGDAT